MRDTIKQLIAAITPYDHIEENHVAEAIEWISGTENIYRLAKPATPPKHLVSYFVIVDVEKRKLLLMDHIKAGRWLPTGGHVEKDEDPKETVRREIKEELGQEALFIFENPLFITKTQTVNIDAGHTDVSLWYVLAGDSEKEIVYDSREFNSYQWLDFENILQIPIEKLDPHMHRFTKKLQIELEKLYVS